MPALPDVPATLRVACSGLINASSPFLTRFYVEYTGTAPTTAQLTTFNGVVSGLITSGLINEFTADRVFHQIESIDLTSPTSAVSTTAVTITGTRTGTALPAAVCFVGSYEVARRYRGGHPRGYWPFGNAADVTTPTTWSAGVVTGFTSALNTFFTGVVGAGWSGAGTLSHVNVSYYEGFTVVTNPITGRARNVPTTRSAPLIDPVTTVVGRSSIGTQRRRAQFID